jgi:mannose-6-phosphate isomerase-like protein (cupin superfamily)
VPKANWKSQVYGVVQSLLYNNPHRVIDYLVESEDSEWKKRSDLPAPVRRLYETEASDERTCLQTIQFVHHMLIPPGGRHVQELHVHPNAEELVVVTTGTGQATVGKEEHDLAPGDVLYVPPSVDHEVRNTGDDMLGVIFINVPTGDGLAKLQAARATKS